MTLRVTNRRPTVPQARLKYPRKLPRQSSATGPDLPIRAWYRPQIAAGVTLFGTVNGNRYRRREFISALGGVSLAWPVAARAQQLKIPMIGSLLPGSKVASKQFFDGFPLGMQEKGYVEGRDYVLESRYADSDLARLPLLAEELVRIKPDVIVTGTSSAALAAKQATANIPIVGVNLTDPVGTGLVVSEARPGTNVTGTLQYLAGLTGKQLDLARDLVPGVSKVGVLGNAASSIYNEAQRREAEAAAAKLGLSLLMLESGTADEIGHAFQTFVQERTNVVVVLRDILFLAVRRQIAAYALAAHLPTIFAFREHARRWRS